MFFNGLKMGSKWIFEMGSQRGDVSFKEIAVIVTGTLENIRNNNYEQIRNAVSIHSGIKRVRGGNMQYKMKCK